jgi:hypothetical protein
MDEILNQYWKEEDSLKLEYIYILNGFFLQTSGSSGLLNCKKCYVKLQA